MDELMTLRGRLQRANERRDSNPASSPDWDAAMAEVEDLTDRIWRMVADPTRPAVADPRELAGARG